MSEVLAIDIGGTKMAGGLVNDQGEVRLARSLPTPPTTGAPGEGEQLFRTVIELIEPLLAESGSLVGCGIGCGGPMASGGQTVSPVNIAGWREFPLRDRLVAETDLATWIDNDAKALALAEGWCGAAAGASNYVAMVVSTGVGGGIVLDGRLLDGVAGNAGHIGHIIVEPGGRVCGCGARGCLEAEASGTAIAAISGAHPREAPPDLRRRTGMLVGRAVASTANLLDVTQFVIAGSVALGFGDEFFDAARAEARQRAMLSYSHGLTIEPAGLGAAGPLVGAGAVAWRGLGQILAD